nr:programmed cell death protein 7 [Drosophila takahashii]
MDSIKNLKLSQIKANIQHVIANLERLEQLGRLPGQELDVGQAEELQRTTTTLLDELDQVNAQRVADIQKQRKRWRRLVKEKKKRFKRETIKTEIKEQKYSVEPPRNPLEKQAEHISLRKKHDAASILETFDLLEKLCESRGGDKAALRQKLSQMRRVWRRVQEENQGDHVRESQKAASIESQWQAVFFGNSEPLVKENKEKFLEIRSTWDSYISFAGRGSCIPRGWVLPPMKPTAQWAAYRITE